MRRSATCGTLPTLAEKRAVGTELADERFRGWLRGNLVRAAGHFGLTLVGEPVFGWRLRSISAGARDQGHTRWLRVLSEQPQWLPGEFWTGNADANIITEVAKPTVLATTEWDEHGCRRVRAELMTLMPGAPASETDVLHTRPELVDSWWTELRRSLDVLGVTMTSRTHADQAGVTTRIHERFGGAVDSTVTQWATVHGDVHWANLMSPRFAMLDWELWGRGPAGTDAATLLCYSLPVPEVADTVRAAFADVLDTPTGRVAQLAVIARLLRRVDGGDYPELAQPLRELSDGLLGR
jgi:hypothetical protein